MSEGEVTLSGGNVNLGVVRVGDTVRRSPGAASASVHALLRHLEVKGFAGSPRFRGIDARGREILSFFEGEAGCWPAIWRSEIALVTSAQLLRAYHDASCDFRPEQVTWVQAHPDPAQHEVICHNDFGAYNIVFDGERAVGMIDFDLAGPGPRLRDIAYGAYWMTPLSLNSDDQRPFAKADLRAACRRLKLFCASYGIAPDAALFDAIEGVLWSMGDEARCVQLVGAEAAAKLIADGHLQGWRGEAEDFARNKARWFASL
jgi:aminoglycoside phosphotransferase (APT) family kinase protein